MVGGRCAQDEPIVVVSSVLLVQKDSGALEESKESSSSSHGEPVLQDLLNAELLCTDLADQLQAIQNAYDVVSSEHDAVLAQAQARDENNRWLIELNRANTRELGDYERVVADLRGKLKQVAQVDAALRLVMEEHPLQRNSSVHVSLAQDASAVPVKLRRTSSPPLMFTHSSSTIPSISTTSMAVVPDPTQPEPTAQNIRASVAFTEDLSDTQKAASNPICLKASPWKSQARGDPAGIPGRFSNRYQNGSAKKDSRAINLERSRQNSMPGEQSPSGSPRTFMGMERKSTVMFAPVNPLFGQFTTDMEQSVDWAPSLEDWHAQKDFGGNVAWVGSNPTNPLYGRKTFELTNTGTWLVLVSSCIREAILRLSMIVRTSS